MPDPISWAHDAPYFAAALVFGYLLGAIPFGIILTRLAGTADLRAVGSGNIGATNVLRTGRKDLAAATLLLDALKGAAAVLIAGRWGPDTAIIAGLGAFLGHLWPVWLKFHGGKGVATFLGILIGLHWPTAAGFAVIWLIVAALTRYSSLAALIACAAAPALLLLFAERQSMELAILLAVLIALKHRANIARLLAGRETRIGAG